MRRVEEHMGMPISIDIPGTKSQRIFDELFALCEDTDNRFSPYKNTSELQKLWRGQIKERDVSDDMKHIIAECERYEQLTDRYFSARFAGTFNPTGYVKAWAIERMTNYLAEKQIKTYLINAGGDIVAHSDAGHNWNIAIANPLDTNQPIATLKVDNIAVATSGLYERGAHIYDPHTKQPVDDFASVTIFGPDITTADVFATAVFAMGDKAGNFIAKQRNYQAIIIDKAGNLVTTAKT